MHGGTAAVTPEQRFTIIVCLLTAALGGLGVLGRALFRVSQQWVRTGDQLAALSKDIEELIKMKEKEHSRLESRDDRLEARIERHEAWHAARAAHAGE